MLGSEWLRSGRDIEGEAAFTKTDLNIVKEIPAQKISTYSGQTEANFQLKIRQDFV